MAPTLRFRDNEHDTYTKNNTTIKIMNTNNNYTKGRTTTRPTSDPTPAPVETVKKKSSKSAFSSLGFGKGGSFSNVLTGGGATSGGGTKTRKGLRGLFSGHKKDSSASSGSVPISPTSTVSSAGNSASSHSGSVRRGPLTFTADSRKPLPALPEPEPVAPRGSIGRALWGKITGGGSVRESKAAKASTHATATAATGVPMTLSHAPPFPTSTSPSHSPARDDRHQRTSARHRKSSHPVNLAPTRSTATETDRIGLSAIFDMPPDESRRTAQPPRTRSTATHSMRPPPSTGSTTRPSLGNLFLGPLSTPAEEERDDDEVSYVSRVRSVRMSIATKPEMAELGYETVIASGIDTVRRRSERVTLGRERAAPLSVGSEVSDPASSVSDHLTSIGIVNRANKTLHELVARLELSSPTASPASSPAKTLRSNYNASQQSISSAATSMFPSPTPAGRVRAPLTLRGAASSKRIKPKSRLSAAPETAAPQNVPNPLPVEERAIIDPDPPSRSPSRSTFGHVDGLNEDGSEDESESGLPEDLRVILSDSERTTWGANSDGSTVSPPSSPPAVVQGLPPPPPTNRISPRRAQLQVNLPVPQAFGMHVVSRGSQPGSDDASSEGGALSPGCRDSSTFDFTGEIGKLNANVRASFVDQLPGPQDESERQGKSRRSKSADETGADAFVAISPGHSRTSSSPQAKGVINSNFKFGSPLTPAVAPSPVAAVPPIVAAFATVWPDRYPHVVLPPRPANLPTFAFRAPTPSSPPRSTFLPETSFMCLDSPSSRASETSDMDVDMDDPEFDTRRFSMVSDNSEKQRERRAVQTHRRSGHDAVQSSATSFASIASMSSLGCIISGGSPDPFAFDFPSERSSMNVDPDASYSTLSYEERSRMDSTFSAVTQSSLGVVVRGTHGITDPFNFAGMRIGESFSTTHTRHNRTFSAESGVSNFSFQDPNHSNSSGNSSGNQSNSFGRSHHRRQSSIASIAAVGGVLPPPGPPVSLYNKPKAYGAGTGGLSKQRSSTGRPDWARHRRQQSSMDSQASGVGGRYERPGMGERMFSPDQGVQLFSITASPTGSTDESFVSQQQGSNTAHVVHKIVEERSDSSDSEACRTSAEDSSFEHVAVRQHGHQSSTGSDSLFHSTDESYNRSHLSSFALKPLRPLSGVSAPDSSSDSGELNEDDTFAFKRQTTTTSLIPHVPRFSPLPKEHQRVHDRSAAGSTRPVSVMSNTSSVFSGANDTFANTKHRAAPLPFSLPTIEHEKKQVAVRPAIVSPVALMSKPVEVSPLRIKRKAVPRMDALETTAATESPRKARLVDANEIEKSSAETLRNFKMPSGKGMTARPSLEESCLIGEGEDLSFSSQDLSMSDANALGSSTNTNLSASTATSRRSTGSARPRASSRNKTNTASANRSRPITLVFSPAPPDTPPMTSPSASESSNQSTLDLSFLMSSLAASVNAPPIAGVTTRSRSRRADMAHRRRTSGVAGPVIPQATITEEERVPSLCGSPSTPSTGNSLDSSFPSPMFLRGREPDIAAYDDDPETMEAMRGWREWERDARYEHGKSQAKWVDTEYSAAMMANFHPPTKVAEVKAFVTHSTTTFVTLALSLPSKSSLLIHRRSSSLTESRLAASPYFTAPPTLTIPLKTKLRSKRPSPLPTKFGGSSPLLANFPPAPPSAKFAQFARERPVTPPSVHAPTLDDVVIPGASLAGPWQQEVEEKKAPSSTSVKKAKRVSEDMRRSKLGWARRKTSDANGAIVNAPVNASVKEVVLDKAQQAQKKRTSLIYQDAPTSKLSAAPLGLTHDSYRPNNKENFFMHHSNASIKPLITRATSTATATSNRNSSSLIPRPIRA